MRDTPSSATAARTWLGRAWEAWDQFWFQPANPTTLGFIRICCGLLVLYTHLAYTWDLYEFFGKNAWISLEQVNEIRRDSPWLTPSANWLGTTPNLYLPDDPDLREDLFRFLINVPDDVRERARLIEYIKDPDQMPVGLYIPTYVLSLPLGPPDSFEPRNEREVLRMPTKWQINRFINSLPEDQAERTAIVDYIRVWGPDPRQLLRQGGSYWSVWFHVTDPAWMLVTHIAILFVMLLFTVGFCTRVTSVLTWLAAVSYIHRSSITLFGGDTMMNILLLYLMIAPSGAALSVDRLLAHWWKSRKARREGLPTPAWTPPEPSVSANFATRLLMIHFCIIYFAAGTAKLLGGMWWNGTAIYYTMANYEFAPMNQSYYLAFMRFLAERRWLWEIVMHGGTFFTLALEIGFPFLVWNRRLRPMLVAASMTLHISIALFMGLVIFSLFMATLVMAFIPGEKMELLVAWLWRRLSGKEMPAKEPVPDDMPGEVEQSTADQPHEAEPHANGVTETPPEKEKSRRKKNKGGHQKEKWEEINP